MPDLRLLPAELAPLVDMALDLRWTWSHGADALWRQMDAALWEQTRNPWFVLGNVAQTCLQKLAGDAGFMRELRRVEGERRAYLAAPSWYEGDGARLAATPVVYFSMEFGLGEAIPLYAGGLGILAGDYLKAASDLGLPVTGIGILFQQGYSRQELDAAGQQHDVFPYNDPSTMPLQPARRADGSWLRIPLQLPGRKLWLRVWKAVVGRVSLYLLDGNDPLNSATDRGVTSRLYEWNTETRLFQEMILGIGGWGLAEALGLGDGIAHLNEGHAAFAVIERARRFMLREKASFVEALWATRAGNIFTTHTPVAAGFDRYPMEMIERFRGFLEIYASTLGMPLSELMALGRGDAGNPHEPVNLSYLAVRGSAFVNAVSRRHAEVSRGIFSSLFPRWPLAEVPVGHVTNGVHMPTWDSSAADRMWTEQCGKARWLGADRGLGEQIAAVSDETIWQVRNEQRAQLVAFGRRRLQRQLQRRGVNPALWPDLQALLDPAALTLGFARRFASYKRPELLLRDPERLARLLRSVERPLQIIVAGKAHPADTIGKSLVADWIHFAARPDLRLRVLFIEDYDIGIAEQLVRGVDVWINTPRPPWEASGTSGMKVLVNGGLNLSQLDGWWAEAYTAEVGWAIGSAAAPTTDQDDAEQLYGILERELIPEFYDRDAAGLPRRWLARTRASLAQLTPAFSANRMARDYLERLYLPAATLLRGRTQDGAGVARRLAQWAHALGLYWGLIRFGDVNWQVADDGLRCTAAIDLAGIAAEAVRVELYAEAGAEGAVERQTMLPLATGAEAGALTVFEAHVQTRRPAAHFTVRIVPQHAAARLPQELPLIAWQR